MPRIQNPRIRAITEGRRGWKPTPRPKTPPPPGGGGGGGGNRNTPAASFTPPPLTPPEADPGYQRIKGMIGPSLEATRRNIDAQQEGLLTHYGLGSHIRPGSGEAMRDAQGMITGYKPGTGVMFDYSNNPESLAARLQRSFEQGRRGTRNSLAARGLRRSGALDRQEGALESDRISGLADLRQRLTSALLGLEGDYSRAYTDAVGRLSDAMQSAIDRQVANAAPVPAAPPARKPAPSASRPQPGGKTAGKGKRKVGIGGAQKVRRARVPRMTLKWR